MRDILRCGDGLVTFGVRDLVVRSWNERAEQLTGIPAVEAIGRPCWDVLRGEDKAGGLVCHAGCSGARMAREGRPAPSRELRVAGRAGRIAVDVATLVLENGDDQPLCVHVLRAVPDRSSTVPRVVQARELTARQREVLALLADGLNAKAIAGRLGITKLTARNHIRAIREGLGCHSQLEAVAEARRRRLV
jgi:DNA-binding CsgD family transcriptional regulator